MVLEKEEKRNSGRGGGYLTVDPIGASSLPDFQKRSSQNASEPAGGPVGGQTCGFAFWHLDEGESLAGGDEEKAVGFAMHFEFADETGFGDFSEPAPDDKPVAEAAGALIVDFSADEHGKKMGAGHFA